LLTISERVRRQHGNARLAAQRKVAGILILGGFCGPCVAQNPSLRFVRALHSWKKRTLIVARFYTRHIFLFFSFLCGFPLGGMSHSWDVACGLFSLRIAWGQGGGMLRLSPCPPPSHPKSTSEWTFPRGCRAHEEGSLRPRLPNAPAVLGAPEIKWGLCRLDR
jgi:hypothetical protein